MTFYDKINFLQKHDKVVFICQHYQIGIKGYSPLVEVGDTTPNTKLIILTILTQITLRVSVMALSILTPRALMSTTVDILCFY